MNDIRARGINPMGDKVMAGLNDMIRSAFPGGSVGKPLMLALGALLASDPKRTLVSGIGTLV